MTSISQLQTAQIAIEIAGLTGEDLYLAAVGVVMLAAALFFVGWAIRRLRETTAVLRLDRLEDVGVPGSAHPLQARGSAEPVEELVTTPVSGENVVGYEYEKQQRIQRRRSREEREQYASQHDVDPDSREATFEHVWETQESHDDLPPFDIETGVGRVRVDPAEFSTDIEVDAVHRKPWWRRISVRLPWQPKQRAEREVEAYIHPGESVIVGGSFDPSRAPGDSVGTVIPDPNSPTTLTTRSGLNLRYLGLKRAANLLLPAAVCAMFGVALVVYLIS